MLCITIREYMDETAIILLIIAHFIYKSAFLKINLAMKLRTKRLFLL